MNPTQKTPVRGLYFDFNYGLRVKVPKGEYRIRFVDMNDQLCLFDQVCSDNFVSSKKKYFLDLRLEVFRKDKLLFRHDFNPQGKKVLVSFSTNPVIGDVLAWIPYVERFQQEHQCEMWVQTTTHMAELLAPNYPTIHFVKHLPKTKKKNVWPQGVPKDIYATYYVCIFPANNRTHQVQNFRTAPLQQVAATILGLGNVGELKPHLLPSPNSERLIKEPYVCIGMNASSLFKHWHHPLGWRRVVEFLHKLGYRVLCIDQKPPRQRNMPGWQEPDCEDFRGNLPLQERVNLLAHADFFIGLSSGLSWLAWGTGIPVVMISGFTYPWHEFSTPYRVISYHGCTGCWNDPKAPFKKCHQKGDSRYQCSKFITPGNVIRTIFPLILKKK